MDRKPIHKKKVALSRKTDSGHVHGLTFAVTGSAKILATA